MFDNLLVRFFGHATLHCVLTQPAYIYIYIFFLKRERERESQRLECGTVVQLKDKDFVVASLFLLQTLVFALLHRLSF